MLFSLTSPDSRSCAAAIPGVELLEAAYALPPAERPVPNLGYACLNMDLRAAKPAVFTSRGCVKKTWLDKGLPYISTLAAENARCLSAMIKWNAEHGIHLFRCALVCCCPQPCTSH